MNKIQSGIFQLKTDAPVPEVDMLPDMCQQLTIL